MLSVVTPAALRVEADLSVPGEEGVEAPAEDEAGRGRGGRRGRGRGDAPEGEAPAEGGEGGEG